MLVNFLIKLLAVIDKIRDAIFRYFYFGNFEKKHITYGFVNGKFQITSTNHEDFISAVQTKINKLSESNDRESFIKLALSEALTGCNFIIFSPPDNENLFVQFWVAEHHLKYNFCFLKTNRLEKYFYSILGLLSEYGFVNQKFVTGNGKSFYEIEIGKTMTNVYADFGMDIDSAAKFTETIYKKIYKVKGQKLIVKVE